MKLIEIQGQTFGRLTVLTRAPGELGKRGRWICRCECGNEKAVYGSSLRNGLTRSCGCLNEEARQGRSGPNHPSWKGGRMLDSSGYVLVKAPGHPNANNNGYVREHILRMTEELGRPLLPTESVHHKNGLRADNRLRNLELRTRHHGQGQLVTDMVQFCVDYLRQYEPSALSAELRNAPAV